MKYIEIIIVAGLFLWALYFIIKYLQGLFKKNCDNPCAGCSYSKQCNKKYE